MHKKRPILDIKIETSISKVVDDDGYVISPLYLFSSNSTLVHATIISNGVAYDLTGLTEFYFGLNYDFNLPTSLFYTYDFFVDSSWDSAVDGKISWIMNLRNQSIINYIGSDINKDIYAELWVKNVDQTNCILYQQLTKIKNIVTGDQDFQSLCAGIGLSVIEGLTCPFKIY